MKSIMESGLPNNNPIMGNIGSGIGRTVSGVVSGSVYGMLKGAGIQVRPTRNERTILEAIGKSISGISEKNGNQERKS